MTETLLRNLTFSLNFDSRAFGPELFLCLAIVLMLLIRLIPRYDRTHLGSIAFVLSALTLIFALMQWPGWDWDSRNLDADVAKWLKTPNPRADLNMETGPAADIFGSMLVFDNFSIFIKIFLYAFVTLTILLTMLTKIPDHEDSADFYCLLFGATLGMSIMASANHLLMVFIGIEMASLPSYALAGFLKGRRQSSEAALKYVVYGGGASGVMLYGISLLVGHPDISSGYLPNVVNAIGAGSLMKDPAIIMGVLFVLIGIGFKLAAFPFHFWCPDVFEGAAAEVGAFLSVASKGAALALLARIVLGLAGLARADNTYATWSHAVDYLVPILAVFAIVTTTFGNLAAYGQTNLKRLLAYSTIAHAGFMMMGLATMSKTGAAAVLFYLVTYLFMNLGAFAVVAMMRNLTGQEDLSYYRGFVYRSPLLVVALGVFLLSLLGLPPLAGFAAKFQIFAVLFDSAKEFAELKKPTLSWTMYILVVVGGLNTVLSLFYYVKVLKVMALEKTLEEVEDRPIAQTPAPIAQKIYISAIAIIVLGFFFVWNPMATFSEKEGVNSFHPTPPEIAAKKVTPPGKGKAKQGAE
jgi:NADH-quinone oxidoreductase subunit N